MNNYAYWRDFLAGGRSKYERPVCYATRVRARGEDAIALVHHNTDIVTFYPNGRIVLSNGGWYTVTTLQRLREYGSRHILSERGTWYIPIEPDPEDPAPPGATQRAIPKPYGAEDPGPEPPEISEYRVGEGEQWRKRHERWDWEKRKCDADAAVQFLERFGSREAWQEAYITEFRQVRENRRLLKEWDDRNRVGFRNPIEVTPSGYVPLKAKKAHLKARRRVARINRQHRRELDERAARRARHEQQRAEYKRVRRMMTAALAESIAVELSLKQQEWIDNGLEVFA